MFYLLTQMFLYMLVALLLGVALGWLLWRRGYATDIMTAIGMEPMAADAAVAADGGMQAELQALRSQNSKISSELARANAERNSLQNDLDECRAASSGAAEAPVTDPGTKPVSLSAPRAGKPDDLKEIKGIGLKLETMLHGMGIYHFDQIAAWGPKELAWVDQNLEGFRGRASRDNWIEQAKTLA